jgi:hypothetical protein
VGAIVEIKGGHDSLDIVEGGGGCMDEEKNWISIEEES